MEDGFDISGDKTTNAPRSEAMSSHTPPALVNSSSSDSSSTARRLEPADTSAPPPGPPEVLENATLSTPTASFSPATAVTSAPFPARDVIAFVADATVNGLFPVVLFGTDARSPDVFGLLTAPISDLPMALELIERVQGVGATQYRTAPIASLRYIADKNAVMRYHGRKIPGLDSSNPDHSRGIVRLMNYCTATRWKAKPFALVDIVGFSLLSTAEQLSMRMALGQAVNQSIGRMHRLAAKNLVPLRGFNRISTGDGFYLWSYDVPEAYLSTFTLLMFLMTQVNWLYESGASPMQLRAAFAIGEAYTFPYHGPSVPNVETLNERFMPDAIGPVLNQLARLLTDAFPGQILIAPFDAPGRDNRPTERMNVETLLTRVRAEILPYELAPTDSTKSQDIVLTTAPGTPYRVTDKHEGVHHCFNVAGRVPYRTSDGRIALQNVGLWPDAAPEVKSSAFRPGAGGA